MQDYVTRNACNKYTDCRELYNKQYQNGAAPWSNGKVRNSHHPLAHFGFGFSPRVIHFSQLGSSTSCHESPTSMPQVVNFSPLGSYTSMPRVVHFLPPVIHLYLDMANLLHIFEWCLKMNIS